MAERVPLDQQLTIGVYGRWGSGKTTVLEMIEDMSSERKMHVCWLNPWGLADRDDLWAAFLLSVISALRSAGVDVAELSQVEERALRFKWMPLVDDLSKAAKPVEAAMAGLRRQFHGFFGVGVDDLRKVSDRLVSSGFRLLILVDDLDRAPGAVVMDVFYGIRELLDLPGLVFVLALDPDRVADPLRNQFPERAVAQQFLEKVVHIPRWLPEPTDTELLTLLKADIDRYDLPVPIEDLRKVLDLLPRNPRQARIFVRQLWSLSDELRRYRGDEIDAAAIILIMLAKASWPTLAAAVFDSPEAVNEAVMKRTVFLNREKESERLVKEKEAFRQRCIEEFRLSPQDAEVASRVTAALTERSVLMTADRIVAHAHLVERPPSVTLKEADDALERLVSSVSPDTLRRWVEDHAAKRDMGAESVTVGLFNAWVSGLSAALHAATDTHIKALTSEGLVRARNLQKGLCLLGVDLRGFFGQPATLGLAEFSRCCDVLSTWIQFLPTPGYHEVLEDWIAFLIKVAEDGAYRPLEWVSAVKLDRLKANLSLAPKALKGQLERISLAIQGRLPAELLALFSKQAAFQSLGREEQFVALSELTSAECGLWKGELRARFLELCRTASIDVAMNLMVLLNNLSNVREPEAEVVAFAKDEELILAIWAGATKFEVTQRFKSTLVGIKKRVERLGGIDLPGRVWLNENPKSGAVGAEPPTDGATSPPDDAVGFES